MFQIFFDLLNEIKAASYFLTRPSLRSHVLVIDFREKEKDEEENLENSIWAELAAGVIRGGGPGVARVAWGVMLALDWLG